MLQRVFRTDQTRSAADVAQEHFRTLIQEDQYVGDVYAIGYESATVQINDFYRQKVGGIPSLCFLVATRIVPGTPVDFTQEDSSIILLRVMDAAQTPNSAEAERIRFESAQRLIGIVDHLHPLPPYREYLGKRVNRGAFLGVIQPGDRDQFHG